MKLFYALLTSLLLSQAGFAQTSETEPNNTFTQANPITLGTSLKVAGYPGNDVDYFKIVIDKPGVVDMSAENVPGNVGVRLYLFNAANQELADGSSTSGKNTYVSGLACSAGTYYVLVTTSGTATTTPFDLKVVLNTTDVFECNNSFTTAKEIVSEQALKIAIHPVGDAEYFKIVTTKSGVLDVAVENVPSNINARIFIYNAATREIADGFASEGKNVYLSALACDVGTYYVLIRNNGPSSNPALFDCKISLNLSDAYECNNSFIDAKEIGSGQPLKVAIHPIGDTDFFKLAVPKPGVISVSAENLPATLGPRLILFNPANQVLQEAINSSGRNLTISALVCEVGNYYARISNNNSTGNSTVFDLKITNDTSDIYECNNSFVAAKDIQIDKPIKAAINADNDLDFFKFTLTAKTTLNLTVGDVPANVAMQMIVYNAAQTALQNTSNNRGVALAIRKYALDAGTYYVRLSGSDYASALYTFAVARDTVLPPKLAANVLSVCPGAEVRLTATECTGTVRWSTNQTGLTITARPTAATSYTAVCEDGGRTSLPSLPLTISMNPVPAATASASNNGQYYETQTIQLSASGGGTYNWRGPNNYTSAVQNPTITDAKAGMSGSYAVTVTNTDGCTATASANVTVLLITGLEPDPAGVGIEVSPNPASDICMVKLLLETAAPAQITLLDVTGRSIRQWSSGRASRSHETALPLTDLPSGTYLIRAVVNDKRAVRKVLKQ